MHLIVCQGNLNINLMRGDSVKFTVPEFKYEFMYHAESDMYIREVSVYLEIDDEIYVDRSHIARELADVVYVAYGTANSMDIDLDEAIKEVHRANMHKASKGIRREDGKIIKPHDFIPPNMNAALKNEPNYVKGALQ